MVNDILVGLMCIIALGAGIYCWKMDRGSSDNDSANINNSDNKKE